MLGPWFLSRIRITDPVARGLAVGTTAHGQGTAMMLHEGETQGALSGVEMALAAPRSLRQSWFLGSLTYGDKAVTRNPSGRSP